jgi:hypothetical protein
MLTIKILDVPKMWQNERYSEKKEEDYNIAVE